MECHPSSENWSFTPICNYYPERGNKYALIQLLTCDRSHYFHRGDSYRRAPHILQYFFHQWHHGKPTSPPHLSVKIKDTQSDRHNPEVRSKDIDTNKRLFLPRVYIEKCFENLPYVLIVNDITSLK